MRHKKKCNYDLGLDPEPVRKNQTFPGNLVKFEWVLWITRNVSMLVS